MIRVEFNQDDLTPALQRLSGVLTNLTPVMQDLGEQLLFQTKRRFGEGRAPSGAPWAPKSPVTLERYGARRSNRVDTRPLFGPSGALNTTISTDSGTDWVEVGSNMIYAAVMQFGAAQGAFGKTARNGPIPWGNIPARPFIGLSVQDEAELVELVNDWMIRATQSSG